MIKRIIILSFIVSLLCFLSSVPASSVEKVNIPVADTPIVKVLASSTFGPAPLTVSFDASDFLYHYGENLSFLWDFNDGRISDGVTTFHTYKSKGTYTVGLTVTTPFGPQNDWVVVVVN